MLWRLWKMTSKDLEQMADDLLRDEAKRQHKSMRQLGIIDERRARTVREKESPFADVFHRQRHHQ